MSETDDRTPEEILNEIYQNLQSENDVVILQSLAALQTLNFSSEAIRQKVEQLALKNANADIRNDALAVLNTPAHRTVRQRLSTLTMDRGIRYAILKEIEVWEKSELLEKQNAEVIRRRYDFDLAPQPKPKPASSAQAEFTPSAEAPAPVAAPSPQVPPEPRPTLLQTLTSEASIKVYLYLGAFFVIAAAAILGAVVPELRLPILIVGTLIFGGLSLAIKKRLPQPSFPLFIVFSFLLPITANSLEESLRDAFGLSQTFVDGYWAMVFVVMAIIWLGSTWLYESRLFSITSFGALLLAALRIGSMFDAEPAIYSLLIGMAALLGLAGTHLLKKWRNDKFSMPLFLAVQSAQAINLAISFIGFAITTFEPSSEPLWNLVTFATWGIAAIFYVMSNGLYPFFAFPWLVAAALVPMPWFIATAFNLESFGSAIILMVWGGIANIFSEGLNRLERAQKYSLPMLVASMPSLALAILTGFVHEVWLGMALATGCAILLTALHILRTRWWLWTFALLNMIVAYFAFFQLELVQRFDIFIGYQVIGIGILFLLPDLFLKKDWSINPAWRLPLRVFGTVFIGFLSVALLLQDESRHAAICYFILVLFMSIYALAYQNAYIAYLPATYLPLGIVFALDAFNLDLWLPALSALAILYYLAGVFLRSKENWDSMLRISALALGASLSIAAIFLTKETGGWYAVVMGLLFIAEMHVRKNGWFEIGAPLLFTTGIALILQDFEVTRLSTHLLAHSLVWILSDLLAHLTFTNPRPLNMAVRAIGAGLTLFNYGFLLAETDASVSALAFGIYTLLFLTVSLLYRQPTLLYTFTLTLPLFITYLFRLVDITKWIHPVIVLAVAYYTLGAFLRAIKRAPRWDLSLLYSGLGVGIVVSFAAPTRGGLDASIPVAIAATLWAVEAFIRRNTWLAFPANILYLLAYFIILFELNVEQPQFFSMGTALFGLFQHYLLTRANSKAGTFLMGMFSQFVLLGTTYIQMVGNNELGYFFLLFAQSLVVLVYGLIIRSRSLTFFPIGFVVLGVITVVYSALSEVGAIFVIGCTGILLLVFGIIAVLLRERIAKLGERLSDWKA